MKTFVQYFFVFALIVQCGCKSLNINSYWRNREVTIDGKAEDWEGRTLIIKDLQNVLVGFMNDDSDLYILLTVSDRSLQRQISSRGLTIWFDREGGEEKKFGVHYPLGIGMMGAGADRRAMHEFEKDTLRIFTERFSDELEIYGPAENEHQRIRMQESGGIDIAVGFSQGLLAYEMKIPMLDKGPHPYVIGTTAGSVVGVGIETESGKSSGDRGIRPQSGGEVRGGEPGGGFGRRGGRREMEGGSAGGKGQQTEPLNLWAKIHLALPESATVR